MQFFNSKHLMALGLVLVLASGTQASYAQEAVQDQSVPSPTSATPSEPAPATPPEAAAPPESESEPAPAPAPAPASISAPAADVAAPAVAQLNEVPLPPEGKGQIVFFRPARFVGMAVSFSVREGNTGVGKLTNGTYFILATDPGVKEYNISFEAKDTLRMEVEEGETYYVIQSIAMGALAARPNLTPSSEAAFQEKKLKVTKAVATDHK